jgi:ribosomal-protein-alanine N-acetyltransferase
MSTVPELLPMCVRAMRDADLNAVMDVEVQAYVFPWTEPIFKDCIRVGYHCQILEIDERLEAYGVMSVGAGEAHVLNLCVRPESHGRGFARRLLGHLLELARADGVQSAFLEVRPSNARALQLYRMAGFCEVGMRRGYYPDRKGREDALVMGREL